MNTTLTPLQIYIITVETEAIRQLSGYKFSSEKQFYDLKLVVMTGLINAGYKCF